MNLPRLAGFHYCGYPSGNNRLSVSKEHIASCPYHLLKARENVAATQFEEYNCTRTLDLITDMVMFFSLPDGGGEICNGFYSHLYGCVNCEELFALLLADHMAPGSVDDSLC